MENFEAWLEKRIIPEPNSGCWIWTKAIIATGYGYYSSRYPKIKCQAHRFVYENLRGPIPDGLQLDHLCRVRCCVNPDHLEPVTGKENVRRGLNGNKKFCKHGHSLADAFIRKNGTKKCRECNKLYCLAYMRKRRGERL